MMKTSDIVSSKINKLEKGYIFTYSDFNIDVDKIEALKKHLNRLVKSGKIERLSKGKFYKPKKGIVGNLKPNQYEIVKDLIKEDSNFIGYITGYYIFNLFKLSTQVPNIIQIGTNFDKKEIKRGPYKVRFVRQWNKITKENIPLLQLLDCVRFIKIIPDANINNSIKRISFLIDELSDDETKRLCYLAIKYPPSTRALLGALIEQNVDKDLAEELFNTLKSTSSYNYTISDDVLTNKSKWKIK